VIGDRVTLKNGVAVWDGVVLEDETFVGPNAVFTNEKVPRADAILRYRRGEKPFVAEPTLVRRGATIGANATIICGVTLGQHAFVGAGSVVTRDLPAFGLAQGVPARVVGYVCPCGERLLFPRTKAAASRVCRCGRRFVRAAKGGVRLLD
jgi:UDP-2-acetamido-3-amino-2,3-dideoxy-glucuronate N-acetyltransferase